MISWNYVRDILSEPDSSGICWITDTLYLALNYGYCYNEGKHQNTLVEHWELFTNAIRTNEAYSEQQCEYLFSLLNDSQKDILVNYLEEDTISDDSE